MTRKDLAIIGWAMYYKGYTKQQLDGMSGMETILLYDEYSRFEIGNIQKAHY